MKKLLSALGLILVFVFSSCKRSELVQLGPNICPPTGFSFVKPLAISSEDIDFSVTKSVKITGTLSSAFAWKLVIKGVDSGAKIEFTGKTADINVSWAGQPGSATFFKNEDCIATVEVSCIGTIATLNFKINKTSDFSAIAYPMWDFESGPINLGGYGLTSDATVGRKGTHSLTLYNVSSNPAHITPSPQGGGYLNFKGAVTDVSNPTYYFGGMDGFFSTPALKALLAITTDPERVYFNCYINTNGKASSQTHFEFEEKRNGNSVIVSKDINGNFSGWKLVSFKLSEAHVENFSKLTRFSIAFNAGPFPASDCEINLDMPIFTIDKPFIAN